MIPAISEYTRVNGVLENGLWLNAQGTQKATLHQATITLNEMGDRTITTQVKIDGDVVPQFDGWELAFRGERFILPIKEPQAAKDNTTRNSLVDLTFYSWPIYELKRYFFMTPSEVETGVAIADQYKASVVMPVSDFVTLFNKVLYHYFGSKIQMSLYNVPHSSNPVAVEINYSYIWDVLQKFYELFGLRWTIVYNSGSDSYTINVDYPASSIDDHDFEYGYKGGLLRFERQVQDDNITNVLLGRGGTRNIPYRYFKRLDAENPDWAPDPDAIPELANVYIDRLHDSNFRSYVQGWRTNPNRDTSWEAVQTYDSSRGATDWAYAKGHTDTKFNPVEYVKDDDSIEKYGERWGALDDNDEIYPTIQGVSISPIGRVDEVVAVSEIVTDDVEAYTENAAIGTNVEGTKTITHSFTARETFQASLLSEEIVVPSGSTGNLGWTWMLPQDKDGNELPVVLVRLDTTASNIVAVDVSTGTEYPNQAIPAGTYQIRIDLEVTNDSNDTYSDVTFGLNSLVLTTSDLVEEAWKPTFDIWVKNIWQTSKAQGETDEEYALRVWRPILGDRLGNEAKIVFSDGFMSISQDYEFTIATYPTYDTSKTINGMSSEWKITLYKSNAEYEVTGLFIPNSTTGGKPVAGDHFFFIGIDMPNIYVRWAEEELNQYKQAYLQGVSDINPVWVIQLDKVRAHTLEDEDYGTMLADRLATGITVRTKDSRFTAGEALILYIQTLTFTWNEGYMVPDIEVVLSDKLVAVEGVVSRLQGEVNVIRTTYAKVSDIESVVRKVASPLFLKKTGEKDLSSSPTSFSSNVNSSNFRQGEIAGKGWGFYLDNAKAIQPAESTPQAQVTPVQRSRARTLAVAATPEPTRDANETPKPNPDAVLEIDKLIVRKEMHVNTLVVNQIAYVGGKQITSAAAMECTQVRETNDSYICYFDQKQGSVKNLFAVNDIAMGQVFSAENAEVRYYRRVVTAVDENSITLSKSNASGSGVPKKGDVIVQFGNTTNTDRQYVIIRDVIGGGYDQMLSGLNAVDATGEEYYFAGKDSTGPRWFVGDHSGDYAEFKNNKLKIKADITLEAGSDLAQTLVNLGVAVGNAAKIFSSQPTPPYKTGDIWVGATYQSQYDNDILKVKANVNKQSGDSFSINDWELASGYTSNAALNTFITNTYGPFAQDITSQVDGKAETYYQSSDPASSWTTSALKDSHLGDLWYNTTSDSNGYYHTYIYKKSGSTYSWQEINGVPTTVFNTITGKSSIFTSKPTRAYKKDDLWILESSYSLGSPAVTYPAGTIVNATTDSSIWSASHWTKKDRYVDQSAIDDFSYLTIALGNDTTTQISGGLVLATLIGVKNGNNVVAGMNSSTVGSDNTNGRVMIFAGASGATAIGAALFRVYENGAFYAEKAYIRGEIYAEKGTFRGDLIIGDSSGRHMELSAGSFGTMEFFDSAGNLTTHIGNDYCQSISAFNSSATGNSPTIPSSSISNTYSGSDESVSLRQDKYYTSRSFSVTGDASANILSGNLTVNLSGSTSTSIYFMMTLTAHRLSNGSDTGVVLAQWSTFSWGSQTVSVRTAIPAGTYYLYLATDGSIVGAAGSKSCTAAISGGAFTVTPIAQRLQMFANGLGYRYSEYQYAALLREASSYSGAGDLAFQMRTGSSSNVVGMDIRTTGVKIYGPVRQSLGSTTSMSTTTSTSITNPKGFSFLEIVAKFNGSAETVSMLMPVATWLTATSASNAICISTDSRYVLVYKYSDTAFRIANNNGCSSVAFYGIL